MGPEKLSLLAPPHVPFRLPLLGPQEAWPAADPNLPTPLPTGTHRPACLWPASCTTTGTAWWPGSSSRFVCGWLASNDCSVCCPERRTIYPQSLHGLALHGLELFGISLWHAGHRLGMSVLHSLQGSTSFDSYISILEKVTGQVRPCRAAAGQSIRLPRPLLAACCGCLPQLRASTLHACSPTAQIPRRTLCSSSTPPCRAPSWRSFQRQVIIDTCCLIGPLQPLVISMYGCHTAQLGRCLLLTHPHTCPALSPQAGSAEDWGSGVALPETVLRRATVTLENLSHVSRGDQEVCGSCCLCSTLHFVARGIAAWGREERIVRLAGWHPDALLLTGLPVQFTGHAQPRPIHPALSPCTLPLQLSVADFLAEGDHVTRMLKDWGDSLDRRLPPPAAHRHAAAAAAAAAAGGEGANHAAQHGQHSAQHAQHSAQMAPADVRACVTVLRCILLLSKLAGRFVGRFLPQVSSADAEIAVVPPLLADGAVACMASCRVQLIPAIVVHCGVYMSSQPTLLLPSPPTQLMVLLTAGLRPANPREIKLQCLEGWLGLVRALAADAPVQLGGIVNQVKRIAKRGHNLHRLHALVEVGGPPGRFCSSGKHPGKL